jgi:hypothetical protein
MEPDKRKRKKFKKTETIRFSLSRETNCSKAKQALQIAISKATHRHVVVSLHGVPKRSVVIPTGRDDLVEGSFQVPPNVGIGVFVEGQAGGGVLNEQIAHADIDLRQVGLDGLLDLPCDEVTAPGGGSDGKLVLEPLYAAHHGVVIVAGRAANGGERRCCLLGQSARNRRDDKAGHDGKSRNDKSEVDDGGQELEKQGCYRQRFHDNELFVFVFSEY